MDHETGRSPDTGRGFPGCLGYAALVLVGLVILALMVALAAILERAF